MVKREPTRREHVLAALSGSRAVLDRFGVVRVSLFGSFVRDEADDDSDVDLLVEFSRPIGLFEFVRLQRELADLIGGQLELVTPAALKPRLRDRILGEAIVVVT